jgi:hypothetical protein
MQDNEEKETSTDEVLTEYRRIQKENPVEHMEVLLCVFIHQ